MRRTMTLMFGCFSYMAGMGSLVYLMGWLVNIVVPRSIDSLPTQNVLIAATINAVLFLIFGLQHSVMARPNFKEWWTQFIPAELERSVYVLSSGVALTVLMFFWQPMGIMVWDIQEPGMQSVLYVLYAIGWMTLVGSTFALNHFDLFGLRQVWMSFREQPYEHLEFSTPGPYKLVRHPLYVGWITLAWATPTMSVAHLIFAMATTGYILVALRYEERDLATFHGDLYADYRKRVPMLIPKMTFFNSVKSTKRQQLSNT